MKNTLKTLTLGAALVSLTGCGAMSNYANPFYEPPTQNALLGERTDRLLNANGGKEDSARAAFDKISVYTRAHDAQPVNPVVQPAIVRMMWIPDHLNKSGDLVPAHFYYLKVLSDRWAVKDAFELESQLGGSAGNTSNVPFVVDQNR